MFGLLEGVVVATISRFEITKFFKINWFYSVFGFMNLTITHSEHIDVEPEKRHYYPRWGCEFVDFMVPSKLQFHDANNTRMTLPEAQNHCICKCFRLRAYRVLAFVFNVDIV